MFTINLPKSLSEAGYNFCTNASWLISAGVGLLWMAQPVEAHGTCWGGDYQCTCHEDCHEEEGCDAIKALGPGLTHAAEVSFNQTQNVNGTFDSKFKAFVEHWQINSQAVYNDHYPDHCPSSSSSSMAAGIASVFDDFEGIDFIANPVYLTAVTTTATFAVYGLNRVARALKPEAPKGPAAFFQVPKPEALELDAPQTSLSIIPGS